MKPTGIRLDQALVERALARSRTQAQKLIRSGQVTLDGSIVARVSHPVRVEQTVEVSGDHHYVGRAAGKLIDALEAFPIDVSGRIALDAGASTGGFTQVLRERGVSHVFAVDVGHGQLVPAIAADSGVSSIERVNLRWFTRAALAEAAPHAPSPDQIDLVVGDVSFISLTQVLPRLHEQLEVRDFVLLVKPQFEVGRGNLDRGGLVRDPAGHRAAVERVGACAEHLGLVVAGITRTSVVGGTGNQEFPIWLTPNEERAVDWHARVDELISRR
ncbi:TlyA family RNA methyltransferase [Pseudoclavibacter sp. 13-3]|uniref:TlyA family RNA methyltransferase n=1 Tax=Pseudoclavibacter sp. 13-3 TaxID=2901228 RepID=UPI001E3F5278|nr:TlyA family RNA methyltransferase [Pseudoclavibacter sp. 13-3]MCD7102135.1 TlyA family RNA methyltransferase [Pseudoclavibacter sp. 13-3]